MRFFSEDDLSIAYPEAPTLGLARSFLRLSEAYRRWYGFDSWARVTPNLQALNDNSNLRTRT